MWTGQQQNRRSFFFLLNRLKKSNCCTALVEKLFSTKIPAGEDKRVAVGWPPAAAGRPHLATGHTPLAIHQLDLAGSSPTEDATTAGD